MQPMQVLSAHFLDPEEASLCKAQRQSVASHVSLITHFCLGLNLSRCKKGKMGEEVCTLRLWTARRSARH